MGGKTISNSETKIEALKLQSSAYGVTIPLVFGVTRISGNLLDYLGFQAVPHTETQGGKGGGVKVQNTTYTYKADVMMGLCHGPVTEVPRIWRGKKLYEGGWLPTQIQTSSETYTPPASGAMAYTVANAATWLGVVRVVYEEEAASEGGTYFYPAVAGEGTQYVAAAGVITVLDEALRGRPLTITYQWSAGTRAQTAMDQLGLTFKPGIIGQAAWSALPVGRDVPYSGLAYVAGQGYDLGTGAQVENHMFEVVGPMAYHLGSSVPDVDPADMLRAVLTQLQGGAGFPAALLGDWSAWSTYCRAANVLVSPAMTEQAQAAEIIRTAAKLTNAAPVWSGGRLKMIPLADEAEAGNGATYTPNTTPVYDLDDESYTPASDGASPIRVRLKSAAERYNHWRVEFLNRGNSYNVEIAEAKDAADIEEHGLRSAEVVRAHWICTPEAARKVSQTLLQRSLYINAEYEIPLPWHYALIEPADLLTLTDARLGFDRLPVRVVAVDESEDGDILVRAEDYPPGTASAATYPTQAGSGYSANYNADPGDVDTPAIFEAPYTLAVTGLEVYAAVRGTTSLWGGCQVWVSLDGVSYKQVGTIYGASRYGTLSSSVSAGGASVGVQGLGAGGQLLAASAADAAALQTLCYIGGAAEEYVAYEGATLTAPGAYTLSGLVRGAHSTTAAAHAGGDLFVRVDDRIAKSGAIDQVLIGSTMYFKFTSFNVWGGGQQQLDAVTAWPYTITGSMAGLQPVPGGTPLLSVAPVAALVRADSLGAVDDWSAARATLRVTLPGGADDTAAWAYSIDSTSSLTAVLGGTYGHELRVTGFASGVVDTEYRNALIQVHGYPDAADSSQFGRAPMSVGSSVSYVSGATPVGTGFLRLPGTAAWRAAGQVVYGADVYSPGADASLVDVSGQPWLMEGWVRVNSAGASGPAGWVLWGYPARRVGIYTTTTGAVFSGYWSHEPVAGFNPSPLTRTLTYTTEISFGTWVHVRFSYCSDGVLRLWIDGVLRETYNVGTGRRDDVHEDGPYSTLFKLGYEPGNWPSAGPEVDLRDVRHLAGVSGPVGGDYTPPTTSFADSPAPSSGAVVIKASKSGQPDLYGRFDVSILRASPPSIIATVSPAVLTLDADWAGNVTGPSQIAAYTILVDGVQRTPDWGIVTNPDQISGVTASISGATVIATGMSPVRSSGQLRGWMSAPGYAAQQTLISVGKRQAGQPVVIPGGPPSITIAGATDGTVPAASLPVSAAVTALQDGVDAATAYNWTPSATGGITATNTGGSPTVQITAVSAGAASGTITMTGSRAGWPTLVWQIAVQVTRALLPAGKVVNPLPAVACYVGSSVTASAKVKVKRDGTLLRWDDTSAAYVAAGSWYNPTTTDIGDTHYMRMSTSSNLTGATGAFNSWLALTSDREFSVATPGGGATRQIDALLLISTSSAGASVAGSGTVTLVAESFGS